MLSSKKRTAFEAILILFALLFSQVAATGDTLAVSGNRILRNGESFSVRAFILESFLEPRDQLEACAADPSLTELQRKYCARHLRGRDFYFGRGDFGEAGGSVLDYAKAWGGNTLRFNLNQGALARNDQAYVAEIRDAVGLAQKKGFSAILCIFDSRNMGRDIPVIANNNPDMPLSDESTLAAGETLARVFGDNRNVMLELLNEPWPPTGLDRGWLLWRDGGVLNNPRSKFNGKTFVGVNRIVRAMRAAGARNPIIFQSIAPDFKTFPGGFVDPANQLIYAVHPFFMKNPASRQWDENFGVFADTHPFVITAWGIDAGYDACDDTETRAFFDYLAERRMGMAAYAIDVPWTLIRTLDPPIQLTKFNNRCDVHHRFGELVRDYFTRAPVNATP